MDGEQYARVKGMVDAYVRASFARGGLVDGALLCGEVFGRLGGCFNPGDDGHVRVAAYIMGRYGDPGHKDAAAFLGALAEQRGGRDFAELLRSEFGLVEVVHHTTGRAFYRRRTGRAL